MTKVTLLMASLGLLLTSSNLSLAQRVEFGTIEVSGSAGFSGGLREFSPENRLGELQSVEPLATLNDVSDTEWNAGASAGVGLADNLIVKLDWVRTRFFSATIDLPFAPAPFDEHVNVSEFTGGIEYLIGEQAVVPFVMAGTGVARLGVVVSPDVPILVASGFTSTDFTYNVGAGFRAYMNDHFGLRPAVQFVHVGGYSGEGLDESFWRASFGAFVNFD